MPRGMKPGKNTAAASSFTTLPAKQTATGQQARRSLEGSQIQGAGQGCSVQSPRGTGGDAMSGVLPPNAGWQRHPHHIPIEASQKGAGAMGMNADSLLALLTQPTIGCGNVSGDASGGTGRGRPGFEGPCFTSTMDNNRLPAMGPPRESQGMHRSSHPGPFGEGPALHIHQPQLLSHLPDPKAATRIPQHVGVTAPVTSPTGRPAGPSDLDVLPPPPPPPQHRSDPPSYMMVRGMQLRGHKVDD